MSFSRLLLCFASALLAIGLRPAAAEEPMHFVFITLDDLSRESIGIHGCTIPEITPHMDALGRSGLRFEHMHVQAANCTPSRNIISTGRYQQHNKIFSLGNEGAGNQIIYPALPDVFQDAGYRTGLMGKNSHMSPMEPYPGFDKIYDGYGSTRDPNNVYEKLTRAYADAAKAGKPLYFNLNIFDPHTRWYGWNNKTAKVDPDPSNPPSRIYSPDEVPYPSWFPPLSEDERILPSKDGSEINSMMVEVAAYYNTVKRADDSIGKALEAIADAGASDNTIIVLISDHGVQLPGAKTQLYDHSTRSPLFVVWPGVTAPDTVDDRHMIASMDLLPTFAEMIGEPIPTDLDGRSFAPIIRGEAMPRWRDYIYKQQTNRSAMRALQTKRWLYVFNPWSDGSKKVSTVSTGMHSWRCLQAAAEAGNAEAAAYVQHFSHRTLEELYDISIDPDCLNNLVDDPKYAETLEMMRARIEEVMLSSEENLILPAFQNRDDPAALARFFEEQGALKQTLAKNPKYLREVFYDPHDDWMEIGHTIFEPMGEWGIWEPESKGVELMDGSKHGTSFGAGKHVVMFDSSVAQESRLVTREIIDSSAMEKLKLDLHLGDGKTNVLKKGAVVRLQYNDGSGWKDFTKARKGSRSVNCKLSGGLPEKLRFGILCDFKGASGKVFVDDLRLTAWQDWKKHSFVEPFDATNLTAIRLSFEFETKNYSENDRLLLEYSDGSTWSLLKAYDFGYVLLDGTRYADVVDIDPESASFSSAMRFRFRNERSDSGQQFEVSNFEITSRKASGDSI